MRVEEAGHETARVSGNWGMGHVERNPPRYRCDVSGFDGEDGRRLLNGLLVDQDGFGEEPS